MKKSSCSVQYKQELLHCYENLRELALKKSKPSGNDVTGYSILIFRGMSAWINTFLSLELVYPIQLVSNTKAITNNENQFNNFPKDIHEEAATILTNIVLSHQQYESRSHHYV